VVGTGATGLMLALLLSFSPTRRRTRARSSEPGVLAFFLSELPGPVESKVE